MNALRRVLAAPGLWLLLGVIDLLAARWSSSGVRSVTSGPGSPNHTLEGNRLLYGVVELIADHPLLMSSLLHAALVSTATAVALDLLLAGPTLVRLDGPARLGRLGAAAGRWFAPLVVQSFWLLVLRLLGIGLVALTWPLPTPATVAFSIPIGFLVVSTWPATQLVRARVVLGQHPPLHVRTAWRAWADTLRRPRYLLSSLLLTAGQVGVAGSTFVYASHHVLDPGAVWLSRLATFVAGGLSLWVTALAVEQVRREGAIGSASTHKSTFTASPDPDTPGLR